MASKPIAAKHVASGVLKGSFIAAAAGCTAYGASLLDGVGPFAVGITVGCLTTSAYLFGMRHGYDIDRS